MVVGLLLPFSLLLQQENESKMKKKATLHLYAADPTHWVLFPIVVAKIEKKRVVLEKIGVYSNFKKSQFFLAEKSA